MWLVNEVIQVSGPLIEGMLLCKNDTCWNCTRNWERGERENGRGSKLKYDTFDTMQEPL
jgi:hypothetical protein